ncbi:hypothetical protein GMMP1_10061 [Candidatus Magnetomoraceae bacterium gMMP-1]
MEERLPLSIIRTWQNKIDSCLAEDLFTDEELEGLRKSEKKSVEKNKYQAYGSTLLAVLLTKSFAMYLQIGDGDILTVTENEKVSRPLIHDKQLLGNETTSLCSTDALQVFRTGLQIFSGSPPALILLSTDGYANSFVSDPDFLKVGSDYLQMIRADGIHNVKQELEHFLKDTSQKGSGDDITVGIIIKDQNKESERINL